MAELSDQVNTQLRSILSTLRQRTERVKTLVRQPPTPPEVSDSEGEDDQAGRLRSYSDWGPRGLNILKYLKV